jgi:hypothetical protein
MRVVNSQSPEFFNAEHAAFAEKAKPVRLCALCASALTWYQTAIGALIAGCGSYPKRVKSSNLKS